MKRTNFLKILPFLLLFPIKLLSYDECPLWRWERKFMKRYGRIPFGWKRIKWEQVKKGDILKLWVNYHKRYEVTKAASDCYRNKNGILTIQCNWDYQGNARTRLNEQCK